MRFDAVKATRVCRFFALVLGFTLLAWQREILRHIFGLVDEQGFRSINKVYLEIPKKNGKSTLAAGLPLFMLLADNEPGAEIYSAATTKEQAGIVFREAAKIVLRNPLLRMKLKVIRSTKTIVRRDDPTSFYRAIAADGGAQDGINPHCVIIDELHRWKTAAAHELYDVLTKGTIARRQPLIFEITTAGSTEEESPLCHGEHEYTLNIKSGMFEDPAFYGKIFCADPKDDWTKPETWAKANPSLETNGGFLTLKAMKSECDKAINQPHRLPAFKRYHLGIWLSLDEDWMPPDVWARNSGPLHALIERPCYLGLDLSSTIDLTSLVLLFPDDSDGSYDVLPFFWMAKERVRQRELADRVPYGTWIKQGLMEQTEGDVIDLRDIKRKIAWASEVFSIREVAYDPYHADQLAIELTEELGLKCVPVPPRYTHVSEAMKKTMEFSLNAKFRHNGHDVLKWNMRCVRAKSDGQDNIRPVKPDREKSGKRIDGAYALILAVSRAMFHRPSVYATRGILTV